MENRDQLQNLVKIKKEELLGKIGITMLSDGDLSLVTGGYTPEQEKCLNKAGNDWDACFNGCMDTYASKQRDPIVSLQICSSSCDKYIQAGQACIS